MKTQRCLKLAVVQFCVTLAVVASVNSVPNWPTPEFFERHYHNVATPVSGLTSNLGANTNIGNVHPGSAGSSAAPVPSKEGALRSPSKGHFQYVTLKMSPQLPHQFEPLSMYTPYMVRPQPYQLTLDDPYHPPMFTVVDTDTMRDAISGHNIVALLHQKGRSYGHWGYGHDTKALKPRWSNRRRLSAREAVAVMEEELQQRETTKATNTPIKADIKDDIKVDMQPAASNRDSVAATANRRSGHHMGVTGPVHTFVKTDKHGHYKWGVRHHAGHGFS